MANECIELPNDVETLKAMMHAQARHYEAQLEQRDGRLGELESTIARLHEQINLLLAKRFGASSEKVSEAQLGLFNEAEATLEETPREDTEVDVPAHRRTVPKRKPLPDALPRTRVVHDLAEADKVCPHDGTALKPMGEVVSEQLDIIPAQCRVLRHERLKYACPCCHRYVKTAPMAPQPLPKSLASPGLLAYIATAKFVDALPLYRQAAQFERMGIHLSRATLAGWMVRVGEQLTPLVNLLREELHASGYIHMDETTLQVLDEPGKAPQSTSYLWAQQSGDDARPIVLFDYDPSRGAEVPQRLLEGFDGVLQTDGYAGYDPVVRTLGLTHLNCMAHARRYFIDAVKACGVNPNKLPPKPPDKARRPLKALGYINTVYTIERRLRNRGADADERYRVRQAESVPVLDALHHWLTGLRPKVAPQTKLGEALTYLNNHWDGLVAYCQDGRYRIDNNPIENAIRPFCLGRRNWLFSATPAGARSSAALYSLIQTARANHLEPYAYLRRVFTDLPNATTLEDIEALLPYRIDPASL